MRRRSCAALAFSAFALAACQRTPSAEDLVAAGREHLEMGVAFRALPVFEAAAAAAEAERGSSDPGPLWLEAELGAVEALIRLDRPAEALERLSAADARVPAAAEADESRRSALRLRAIRGVGGESIELRDLMEDAILPDIREDRGVRPPR